MLNLVIFWTGSLLWVLGGSIACQLYRPLRYFFFALLIFSLMFPELSIHFMSREMYRGTTRGFEIHLADLCALILIIAMLQQPQRYRICWFPPMTLPAWLYIGYALLTSLGGDIELYNPIAFDPVLSKNSNIFVDVAFETLLYPFFEISKLIRGYLILWVCANFAIDKQAAGVVTATTALMAFYLAGMALIQRYVLGYFRAEALDNVNIFNCFVGMLGTFVLPLAFYSRSWVKALIYSLANIASLLAIILTVSRSSLAGFLGACGLVTILCLKRFPSMRNLSLLALAVVAGVAMLLKSADTLSMRFNIAEPTQESMAGRSLYNEEAKLMATDHPFGVGLNNFSAYSASHYADIVGTEGGALAHNIWFLTLGELGIGGDILLASYWICFAILWLRSFWRQQSPYVYALLVGIAAALLLLQFQDLFHFSSRQISIFFLTNVYVGLTVAIYRTGGLIDVKC